jgi:NADH-quinone oxidoreductase subunit H
MGLSVVSVVLMAGTLNVTGIVESQGYGGWWYFIINPIGCLIFIITAFAETNRAPFDLPEAEQELVGGYHTEYSGMKFGMFFLAEYVNFFVASFVIVTLFFGGYLLPFEGLIVSAVPALEGSLALGLLQVASFMLKVGFFAFLFIWVRWTLPRFKYNQLMTLGWKALLPISLAWVIIVAIAMTILHTLGF